MFQFIHLIKSLASFLIVYSHCDSYFPPAISFLATGGSWGNALFFLVSGFCLSKSVNGPFGRWMLSRARRIYPAVVLLSLVMLCAGYIPFAWQTLPETLLFPFHRFWFVCAILVFYALIWVIRRLNVPLGIVFACLGVMYAAIYLTMLDLSVWTVEDGSCFKWIYYFALMLLGHALRGHLAQAQAFGKKHRLLCLSFSLLCAAAFLGFRLAMNRVSVLGKVQFLAQLTTMGFAAGLFLFALGLEEKLGWMEHKAAGKVFKAIGGSTLEVFMLNQWMISWFEGLSFPVNFVCLFPTLFVCGVLAHKGIEWLTRRFFRA